MGYTNTATIMDRVSWEMNNARLEALKLFRLNPKHELIPLLIEETSNKESEAHWDELSKLAYKRFHKKLDLSKLGDYIELWKEITTVLSEAVEEERTKAIAKIRAEMAHDAQAENGVSQNLVVA